MNTAATGPEDDEPETLPERMRLDAALERSTELDRAMVEARTRRSDYGQPMDEVFDELDAEED